MSIPSKPIRDIRVLGAAAMLVATIGWVAPQVWSFESPDVVVALFAVVWASIVTFAIVQHGKKGLWLLVSAPVALCWPIWVAVVHFVSIRP